ncbi:hypothetical protein RND71_036724 [Anisodus tanguticus]|uniref:Uncharacterized protein n=1 Tax=Anisodus tanguticus TaxID=243964 RepID=A0AAE1V0K7_9SOLA|nr:hypothetical protein RND71_036724 [Anisodus tanguticus]
MTEAFKRLNQTKEELQLQNIHLIEKVTRLELVLRQIKLQTQTQNPDTSSPTPTKMDETGVHSLLNAKKPIVSGIDTTSPVQTVAGKDLSNPLMAVTLPKSENEEATSSKTRRKLPQTLTGSTSRARKQIKTPEPEKDIHTVAIELTEEPLIPPNPEIGTLQSNFFQVPEDHVSDTGSENDYEQDAQDPNDAYDSGMSFDSVALHNLDT